MSGSALSIVVPRKSFMYIARAPKENRKHNIKSNVFFFAIAAATEVIIIIIVIVVVLVVVVVARPSK